MKASQITHVVSVNHLDDASETDIRKAVMQALVQFCKSSKNNGLDEPRLLAEGVSAENAVSVGSLVGVPPRAFFPTMIDNGNRAT